MAYNEIPVVVVDKIVRQQEEITSLRQQVQELQAELACYRPDENWKSAYLEQVELHNKTLDELAASESEWAVAKQVMAESQAREAKLRDLIEHVITEFKITYDQYEMCRAAIAEPQDDTALREAIQQEKRLLAESQAREAKLREVLNSIWMNCALRVDRIKQDTKEALALPQDDTALKEYRRKVLMAAANFLSLSESADVRYYADELRRMVEVDSRGIYE